MIWVQKQLYKAAGADRKASYRVPAKRHCAAFLLPTNRMKQIRTTTLLFCALFLRGVEEAAASQRGRCVGALCSFQERLNFHAANKFCKDKNGQLFEHSPGDDMKTLRRLLSAVQWKILAARHRQDRSWKLSRRVRGEGTIHPNNVSCVSNMCADCAQLCHPQGETYVCACHEGYRLDLYKKGCVDVDECKEEQDACTNEGEECVNVLGGYECRCMDGFDEEDGACVNVSMCQLCEHMMCSKINGVYQCACREGFRVSPADPTKCVINCTERDCPALCNPDPEREKKDMQQCFCPDGYITDISNQTATCTDIDECEYQRMCDHECENLFGGYRCKCRDGYTLQDSGKCVLVEDDDEEEYGSGTSTVRPITANSQPRVLPVLRENRQHAGHDRLRGGVITLLACLVRHMLKRCSTFKLHSFKRADIDMFYLQQVTTETYKRLSFDKPFKNDSQRLSTPQETQTIGT
ncbi:thrombomodulin-like [Xenentodon cancila]